jgi:hypothetical protein
MSGIFGDKSQPSIFLTEENNGLKAAHLTFIIEIYVQPLTGLDTFFDMLELK